MIIEDRVISCFNIHRPRYESTQEHALEWILHSHAKSESLKQKHFTDEQLKEFKENLKERLNRVGCKPDTIMKRGHELEDFLHFNWSEMKIFNLDKYPQGAPLAHRQQFHQECNDAVFQKFYPIGAKAPEHLIHVSCTGYAAPSSAQRTVSKQNWEKQTTVTHAYHMGCYGSIPGIRMGASFTKGQADIVHTEVCTLHKDPSAHGPDKLVAQSLFADGFIKYSITSSKEAEKQGNPYLRILTIHEQIIPDSLDAMSWELTEWGFHFFLAKEIPVLIARHLKDFVLALCDLAQLGKDEKIHFAIHPGGPKILQYAQKLLEVEDSQIQHSRTILWNCGNMSSATIPHVWDAILKDASIPSGTKIVSLAFGPGLTMAGAVLEKVS